MGRNLDAVVFVDDLAVGVAGAVGDPGTMAGLKNGFERGDEAAGRNNDADGAVILVENVHVGFAIGDHEQGVSLELGLETHAQTIGGPQSGLRFAELRFFARRGEYAKAAAQGEKIYAAEPAHPAGLYLKAEGALAAGKPEEAAKLFRGAVDADRDPQYLDGQGRAAEALSAQTGEAKLQDVALRAYMAAAELAPTMFNPHVGLGRLYLARREAAKAIPPLLEASKLRPDDPEVTRLIGLAYKELQERHVAIEWLARAYRLAPAAETAWHLGQLYGEVNATRDAIAAYGNATRLGLAAEQAGAKLPWLTEALYKLGRIYMDSGNEQAAKAAWVKFVRRNPKPGAQLDEVRRELETTLQRY